MPVKSNQLIQEVLFQTGGGEGMEGGAGAGQSKGGEEGLERKTKSK